MKPHSGQPGRRSPGGLLATLACCLLLTLPASAHAAGIQVPRIEVDDALGVYNLDAFVDYHLTAPVREALTSGVDLVFEMRIEVYRNRALWWDAGIAALTQRYRLGYRALSRRFVVKNLNTGIQETFTNLSTALRHQGQVRNLPIIDTALLSDGAQHFARLRVELALDELPLPIRTRAYTSRAWWLSSDWYQWELP